MQVHITGRHVDVTDGIREHIYEKVERTLVDFPHVEDVRIVLDFQKLVYQVEVLVQGKNIHVEGLADSENLFAAIDDALIKAERQLRKLREKQYEHHRHPEH